MSVDHGTRQGDGWKGHVAPPLDDIRRRCRQGQGNRGSGARSPHTASDARYGTQVPGTAHNWPALARPHTLGLKPVQSGAEKSPSSDPPPVNVTEM